jgi:hypothetical protein
VLILTSVGELNPLALYAVWILPLIFTFFNASPPQLLWLNFPHTMESLLNLMEEFRTTRLAIRTALVIPWQVAGWWIVFNCFKSSRAQVGEARSDLLAGQA